jgi:hypothetical protein
MSYTVYELRDSESGSIDNENFESGEVWNVTKKYIIGQCPGGLGEVKDAITGYLPRYWQSPVGYWRRKGVAIKGIGKQCFECTGEYTTLVPASDADGGGGGGDKNDSNYQFVPGSIAWDTTGSTEHISSALSERVVGGDTDNFEGAINVQGTSVQGIDKVVPAMKYSETWIMPAQIGLSVDFVKAVYTLTGTVNASQFRAFSPGEALFMGARAQWSGDQPYTTVTFDFQARANNPAFYVKGLPQTTKEGWEFAWVVYTPHDSASGLLVQKPRSLVIDQIYEKKEWTTLKFTSSTPGKKRTGTKTTAASTAAAVAAFFN